MKLEDCYQLGYIIKPHGLKGEVQILLDADDPLMYKMMESVFVLQGQNLVPFFLQSISINQDKAIVKFEDVDHVDMAKAMKGQSLFLPLTSLPPLEGNDFYFHELEGVSVKDMNSGEIGSITNLVEAGGQKLMTVLHESGKEILIPYNAELINSFDKSEGRLIMNLPEGLVDLYLNEES